MPPGGWKPGIGRTGASTAVRRAAVNAPAILEPGTILAGRYEIIVMLGLGGMGAVYKAYDRDIDRVIALKVIRPDLVVSTSIIQRFKQELILARQVTHRNVIRIHDLGEADGVKFITMEYIEGEPLTNILQSRGKLPPREAAQIIEQVGIALQTAHAEGVVHRDLKPANIMRDSHGRIVVMDFGLAHSMDVPITHSGNRATKSIDATVVLDTDLTEGNSDVGHLVGTPLYMSPEQARREETDWRSDIYTLGLIFYELLSGKPPFRGRNAIETISLRLEQKPKPLVEVDSGIPRRLNNLVGRCLERAPKDRYQSMQELLRDLRAYLHPARTPWRWASVAGAAIVILALTQILLQQKLRHTSTAAHTPVSVLVADFKNNTGESVFDGALEPAIGVALEGASFITDYNRGTARKLAEKLQPRATTVDEQLARLVAEREGINAIVGGDIAKVGDSYRVSVKALDAMTGKSIWSQTAEVDKEHVLLTMGKLAAGVRKALGDTTPQSVQMAAADTFTTGSLEAAHEYALAQESFWNGKHDDAVQHYLNSIQLDPNLGRAYSGLAAVYQHTGRLQESEKSYLSALSKLDRMTDREKYRTRSAYYLLTRNNDKAIEELSELVRQFPSDSAGMGNLALAYFYKREMSRALDLGKQAVAIYPNNVPYRSNVALYAMYAGDFDTAIKEENAVLKLNPAYEKAYVAIALSQLAQGNTAAAQDTYARLQKVSAHGASVAELGLSDLALYQGNVQQAIEMLETSAAEDLASKSVDAAARKFALLAQAEMEMGHAAKAISAADRALSLSQEDDIVFWAGRTYIQAGNQQKAAALAQQLEKKLAPDSQSYGKLLEGEAMLARSKPQEALSRFQEAKSDTWMGRLDSGIAYIREEAYTEADSELENCLKRRGEAVAVFLDEVPTFHVFPPAFYYLGRAQEGLKSPAASESYKSFVAIKTTGPDPLLADAHRRLGPQ